MHAADAALDQPEHHRARRAAGAEHQRIGRSVPSGRAGVEIIDEAFDVGVGRAQFAAIVPQRIGGADRAGARIRHRQRQRALLVRNGDVGADKAVGRKMQHELGKAFGRHRLDVVAALDAERAQPVMMDQRRARMRRRPSDQACGAGFVGTVVMRLQIGQAAFAVNPAACAVAKTMTASSRPCRRGGKPDRGQIDPAIGAGAAYRAGHQAPPTATGSAARPSAGRRSAPPRRVGRP